jgi:hypothetical protein
VKRTLPPPHPPERNGVKATIKVTDFQVLNFFDQSARGPDGRIGSEVILIYALGEDGVVREFANGKWVPFPISKDG